MSKQLLNNEPFTPFHKEPIAWLLLVFPVAAIIWGFVMLSLALNGSDTLVSDSYYKDGVSYTENKAIDDKAKALNLGASIAFNGDEVRVTLTGQLEEEPNTLQLKLIHPTIEDQDLEVFLQRMSAGQYAGVIEHQLNDKRHVWLQSPEQHWRLRTTTGITSGKTITLAAQ